MGVGGLQVHGICGCRMVHKEVVETLYTMRNLTSGDMGIPLVVIGLGVNGPIRLMYLLDLF